MLKESKSIENFSLKSHHSKYSEIGASIEQGSNVYNSRAKNSYRSRLIDISPLTTTNENELIGSKSSSKSNGKKRNRFLNFCCWWSNNNYYKNSNLK